MADSGRAKLLRDAEKHVLQGKISQAIGQYLKIVKSDPEDVLTINTIGDLYLRQGRIGEANKLFQQVAENYCRNNFLLKAIAVYKKILTSDPKNLEINSTIADLYARQGLNVDARIQYLHVADLYNKSGKSEESLLAFEKVAEIDPSNADVQLKLAEICQEQGSNEKAHLHLVGAARARAKAGNHEAALGAYKKAIELQPSDAEVLSGFLESAIQIGEISSVLEHLHQCVEKTPEDIALHELLGRAYLAAGDLEKSLENFRLAFTVDDGRYDNFLSASKAFLEAESHDRAAECLDPIISVLISRRETDKAVEAYQQILESEPEHLITLKKLADLFSATNDEPKYLDTLQKIAHFHSQGESPADALEYIERILQINPSNEEYQEMHRRISTEAFPGTPYTPPSAVIEARTLAKEPGSPTDDLSVVLGDDSDGGSDSKIVEIDLLLNYGMKEKALKILREMETQDPKNREVRTRLAAIYREDGQNRQAAEQCLLISALQRKAGDADAAEKMLLEAQKLAPEWVDDDFNIKAFAAEHGIMVEEGGATREESATREFSDGLEVDLSGDLSEIFFRDGGDEGILENREMSSMDSEAMVDEMPSELPPSLPAESVGEQLQEVDFYIRLGFHDEARSKLDEIAKKNPDNPELTSRYQQLDGGQAEPWAGPTSTPTATPEEAGIVDEEPPSPEGESPPESIEIVDKHSAPAELEMQEAVELPEAVEFQVAVPTAQARTITAQEAVGEESEVIALSGGPVASETVNPAGQPDAPDFLNPASAEARINTMFADLIDEVNALTDQEIAREDFETHFNLGIAYREMGLIDEAIKEFQGAMKVLDSAKSPREAIQCSGMLSTCFLDKGMPRSAIRWCQTGLGVKDISQHETLALQYDLGIAHSLAGDSEKALDCYGIIFSVDPSYRDVAQKIDNIRGEPDLEKS